MEWIYSYNAAKTSSSRDNLLSCQVNPLGAIGTIVNRYLRYLTFGMKRAAKVTARVK